MGYSAKKPYHHLKRSIIGFYKARVSHMKQLLTKLSEFEKPYIDISYPEMHLQISIPDWPTWEDPWIPGPIGPPLPPTPPPDIPPGPPGPWPIEPPPDDPTEHRLEGCLLLDLPLEMEPDETADFFFTGGRLIIDGRTVQHECALLWTDGPGRVEGNFVCGPYGRATLIIDTDAQDGDIVNVYALGDFGSECATSTRVSAECLCEEVFINYTTLQMTVGGTQDLSSSNGLRYDWVVTIGDSTTITEDASEITVTAPSSNINCQENIIVTMQCGTDSEAEVCDTITIAVNDWDDMCDSAYTICCQDSCCPNFVCYAHYNCAGGWIINADCGTGTACADPCPGQAGHWVIQDFADHCNCGTVGCVAETRSAAMKSGGCCPESLV